MDRVAVHRRQAPWIVMPDLIGHPGVHVGVKEWPHEERGRLGPRLRGGDDWEVRGGDDWEGAGVTVGRARE